MSLRKPHLLLVKSPHKPSRSLAKGITAGLVGGLVATAARALSQKAYPPHPRSERHELTSGEPAPATRALSVREKVTSSRALPWAVGAAAGAAYGAVAEYYPPATSKDGAGFGMALGALSQDGPLTAIGLIPPSETSREKTSAMTSFVVFGVVTETVRRVVRRFL